MTLRKKIIVVVSIIILLLLAGIATMTFLGRPMDKDDSEYQIITVEAGSSTGQIASTLKEKGTIRNTTIFKIQSKIFGYDGDYKAGQYAVSKSMSAKDQMELICSGKTAGNIFTIPEGNNLEKDANLLVEAGLLTKEDFYDEVKNGSFDYKFLENAPKDITRLEGFLYPDTYQVDLSASAHDIIDIMLKQFDKIFVDKYYKKAEEMDLSVNEVITVASIVEREAKTEGDKKKVASVIYNRLEKGMPLQMDSILAYITGEEKIKASLEDTQVESSYNPYTNKGLPPGPICSPSLESIKAALYPADTDYLYFVASEKLDGTNVFSEDYETFLKDKAKFDKAYQEYIKKHPDKE